MSEENNMEKVVIVLNNEDEMSVMAALVMGAAVAATGDQLLLFVQPGAARVLAKGGLEKYQNLKGQPDPIEMMDAILLLDGRVILCELGLPVWDMTEDDLIDGVEVMMASPFLFEAEDAKLTFSY